MGVDYEIVYRWGKDNGAANELFQRDHGESVSLLPAISSPIFRIWVDIAEMTREDEEMRSLLAKALDPRGETLEFGHEHGCLTRQGRVYVPKGAWHEKLLQEFHSTVGWDHSGIL